MKILFLCGSLQPGRDGVGDYTRRLTGELLRKGHQAAIIALHDRQLSEQLLEDIQADGEQSIRVLRLSNKLSWADRIGRANAFIQAANPDWISLQYVPFAFHNKGLPFRLAGMLKALIGNRHTHIMFHELWVGMSIGSSRQHVWWGRLQRCLIQLLLTTLKPNVINTHTPLYQVQLDRLGVQASLLPLFTNIPLLEEPIYKIPGKLRFVFFGGIHPGSPVEQLADEVAAYVSKTKIDVDLTLIGHNGPEQEHWITVWHTNGLTVHLLGEQSPVNISKVLAQSSIGLSTTPTALVGKSGSIAAMHAHGLPVLCVSQPWQPRDINGLPTSLGIFQHSIGNFESFMENYLRIYLPSVNVADITRQFINSLLTEL